MKMTRKQDAQGENPSKQEFLTNEDKEMSDLEKKLKAIAIRKQDRRRRQAQMRAKKRKLLLEYFDAMDQVEKNAVKIIQMIKRRKKSLEPRISQLTEPDESSKPVESNK